MHSHHMIAVAHFISFEPINTLGVVHWEKRIGANYNPYRHTLCRQPRIQPPPAKTCILRCRRGPWGIVAKAFGDPSGINAASWIAR